MNNLMLVGCESRGLPFRALEGQGVNVVALEPGDENDYDLLHRTSRASELIVVGCGETDSHLVADEIWHLLRNKIVLSLSDGVSLDALREMYPLSKVSRCLMFFDVAGIDRVLSICSNDSSYSDKDLNVVKDILGKVGEVLFVKEATLENLGREMDISIKIIREVAKALRGSTDVDKDLFECAISWTLYGLGMAGVKDIALPNYDKDSQLDEGGVMSRLRKSVSDTVSAMKKTEHRG